MKIISWNCSQALRKKFGRLEQFNADIIVCQEAEKLPRNYFKNYHYQWIGHNTNKGIGILVKKHPFSISNNFNQNLTYYLPIDFDNFNLLNVWTHTNASNIGPDANSNIIDTLDYYKDWIASKKQAIIIGDFNNSRKFDESKLCEIKFIDIKAYLNELGFESSYHLFFKEEFGEENSPTLYHLKKITSPFHIDYAFIRGFNLKSVEVGKRDDWIDLSDHMPIIIEID